MQDEHCLTAMSVFKLAMIYSRAPRTAPQRLETTYELLLWVKV